MIEDTLTKFKIEDGEYITDGEYNIELDDIQFAKWYSILDSASDKNEIEFDEDSSTTSVNGDKMTLNYKDYDSHTLITLYYTEDDYGLKIIED